MTPDPDRREVPHDPDYLRAVQAETKLNVPPGSESEPSSMDQQLIGRTLLGCRIQSVIGRGAAGTVFLARHLQIDCLRAIKVLKPELASDRNTDVLSRHLDRHPRDWEMRSKRIALARQLARIVEAFPDLLALESAGQLSDLETDLLLDIYRKQGQSDQAARLLMARTLRDPRYFDWPRLADWFTAFARRESMTATAPA